MESPNYLTPEGIESWFRITGTIYLIEEMHMILAMDDAYMSALSEVREEQRAKDK